MYETLALNTKYSFAQYTKFSIPAISWNQQIFFDEFMKITGFLVFSYSYFFIIFLWL